MKRIALATIVLASLSACESDEAIDARYQLARAECKEVATKAVLAVPGSFSPKHEAVGVQALEQCLSSRGFDVKVAKLR